MPAVVFTIPKTQFFDDNGSPLAGGLLYSYTAGTLTPKATYTDQSAGTSNANPVVLDSAGRADIWLDGSYKFILKDSLGSTIWTEDNVTSFATTLALTNNSVTNAILAQMTANSVKVNNTASTADAVDVALSTNQVLGRLSANIVPVTMGTGANNLVLLDASSKLPAVDASQLINVPSYDPTTTLIRHEDFPLVETTVTTSAASGNNYYDVSSTAAQVSNTSGLTVLRLSTGTTNTGISSVYGWSTSIVPPATGFTQSNLGAYTIKSRQKLTQLSTAGQRFWHIYGVTNSAFIVTATAAQYQVYFRYKDDVNSGKWQAVTSDGVTETATDTGITADTNWHVFEIRWNAGNTEVTFYIDGVLVATNTTNIPLSTRVQHSFAAIRKTVGTTAVTMDLDYFNMSSITRS